MKNNDWKPWEWSSKWKTKAEYFTWLRGQLRKSVWANYFPKNEFKQSQKVKLTDGFRKELELEGQFFHPRTEKVGQCFYCNKWFKDADLQVDHVNMAGALKSEDDVGRWLINLQCHPDNFEMTCVPCHKVKSYAERMGITFEEAKIEKKVIAFSKQGLTKQLSDLESVGVVPDKETKKSCKENYRDYLKQNLELN